MSTSPFFSILTASQNNEETIAETLHSVRSQTFQTMEHINVDGASDDGTIDIIKNYEKSYNLIWLSEPDHGISEALNKGLKLAKGNYVFVLGADDYFIDCNVLNHAHEIIKDQRYDIYSSPVIVDHPTRGKFYYKPFHFLWWHHFKTIFPHQGTFVHRRVFRQVPEFREDISIAFDYDFFYRALKYRPLIKFGSKPIAIMNGTGVSGNQKLLIKRLNEEYFIQKSNETKRFWRILQLIFRMLYLPYKTRLVPVFKKNGSLPYGRSQ
jgi:glycosyltransferase involved in cell wall biosynthesis